MHVRSSVRQLALPAVTRYVVVGNSPSGAALQRTSRASCHDVTSTPWGAPGVPSRPGVGVGAGEAVPAAMTPLAAVVAVAAGEVAFVAVTMARTRRPSSAARSV